MDGTTSRFKPKWLVWILILGLTFALGQSIDAAEYGLGDIPLDPETYQKYLKMWPDEVAEVLPPSYDARDEGIVTLAKDQGICGSCWSFASVGAFESHLLKEFFFGPPDPDLSEQQQISCNLSMGGCCSGTMAALRWWSIRGPVTEDCLAYGEYTTECPTERTQPCGDAFACEQLPYRVTNYHTVSTSSPAQVKTSLYYDGPSYFRFDLYDDFHDGQNGGFWNEAGPGDVYVNSASSSLRLGHAVLIIGWDDSRGDYGAYLCKNSLGETGGPNGDGTFWIAYSGHAHDLGFGMANFSLKKIAVRSAEYFIDEDPGEGNGIPLDALDGAFDSTKEDVEFALDTSYLKIGLHTVYMRMQNEQGAWGTPRKISFEVTGDKYIAAAEYFIDDDPGPGNGTPIPAPLDGSFDEVKESVIADIGTSDLLPGLHTIYARMKDSENHWGTVRRYKIEVREPPYITGAEYYIDSDPGPGNARPLAASDGSFDSMIEDIEGTFNTCGQSLGTHTVFVRATDSYLRWGKPEGTGFMVGELIAVDCEGDFDHDGDVDGFGLAVFAADFGRTDCDYGEACSGDFDADCDVDESDLAIFAADFGRTGCQ